MEIERKFTLKQVPPDLSSYPVRFIEQGYLSTFPTVRIRRDNSDYYLTYKGPGVLSHEEYNLPLTDASYAHLLPKCDGNIISKKRYMIPINAPVFADGYDSADDPDISEGALEDVLPLMIELDVFEGPLSGLIFAEVEFPTEAMANAFIAPDWFDADVTSDPRYRNSYLSQCNPATLGTIR